MRALVTGATGFIGSALCAALDRPVVLARDPAAASRRLSVAEAHAWDSSRDVPDAALRDVDTVFHLAGEPIARGRLDEAHRRRVLESRVEGTRRVVAAIARAARRPSVLVSASAVGFYGSRGGELLDESSPQGRGFFAGVCRAWEQEARAAESLGVRVVTPRIGVVLGHGGGALERMSAPFRLGLGGRLGSGRQWVAWVHLDDVVGLFLHAAVTSDLRGAVNVVAPREATNADLTRALARALHRPALLPVPAIALRVVLGGLAEEVLASQRVVPAVALRSGYRFRHPDLEAAVRDALAAPPAGKGDAAEARGGPS